MATVQIIRPRAPSQGISHVVTVDIVIARVTKHKAAERAFLIFITTRVVAD